MTTISTWDRDTLAPRRVDLPAVYAEATHVYPPSASDLRHVPSPHLDRTGLPATAPLAGEVVELGRSP